MALKRARARARATARIGLGASGRRRGGWEKDQDRGRADGMARKAGRWRGSSRVCVRDATWGSSAPARVRKEREFPAVPGLGRVHWWAGSRWQVVGRWQREHLPQTEINAEQRSDLEAPTLRALTGQSGRAHQAVASTDAGRGGSLAGPARVAADQPWATRRERGRRACPTSGERGTPRQEPEHDLTANSTQGHCQGYCQGS